jgi:hypothetical protein
VIEVEQHGTVQGYRDGCRGRASCVPSFLGTCEEAMIRYRGDYSFSRAVDAGATLDELEARDAAAREADVAAIRAQNAAARAAGKAKRELVTVPAVSRRSAAPAPKEKAAPAARPAPAPKPVSERKPTKAEIRADERGRRDQAAQDARWARDHLQTAQAVLERAESALVAARVEVASAVERYDVALDALRVLDARATAREEREREQQERAAERERARAEREARRTEDAEGRRERKKRGQHTHGTAGGYGQGCRTIEGCPEHALGRTTCLEANRAYHREYRARRMTAAAADASTIPSHGTAYGYQLGCRGDACPATPSCTDAMNAADTARRRAKGRTPRSTVQHGTRSGYARLGCRKGDPCPASPTCTEANRDAQRERTARLRAEAAQS